MPDINVSNLGGGRQNISIKMEDGSKVMVQVRPGKTKVTTTDSSGNTSSETHDTSGEPAGGGETEGGGKTE